MPELIQRKPGWFKIKLPTGEKYSRVKSLVKTSRLHTICEEAKCPNLSECWSHGTATFLILGDVCTRYCGYCNVKTGKPLAVDEEEPENVADAVKKLGLKYAVITSVTRDDLEDGGASIYVNTIKKIRELNQDCKIELLIPDLRLNGNKINNSTMIKNSIKKLNDDKNKIYASNRTDIYNNDKNDLDKNNIGNKINNDALKKIIDAEPDVIGHNIEAVRSVFVNVRKGGDYELSLRLLKTIKEINPDMKTKSGIMVGFGESFDEIKETMQELRDNEVDFLTIGQYLQPSEKHVKIKKFYKPEEFEELKEIGLSSGFKHVESGPLVRSSYRADRLNSMIRQVQ